MIDQSQILSRSQVQLITLFFEVHNCAVPFTSHEFGAEKTNFLNETGTF